MPITAGRTDVRSKLNRNVSAWKAVDRPKVLSTANRNLSQTKTPLKEVIQPQVLLQLPCYDFTPIACHSVGAYLPRVGPATSRAANFRDVTGGVYKARERIHRGMLIHDY